MNFLGEIKLYKPTVQDPTGDNAYTYSVDLLSACFGIDDTFGSNSYGAWKKTQFVGKQLKIRDKPAGLSFTIDDSNDQVLYLHLDDNLNGATEGIHYFTLHVSQKSNDIDSTLPEFVCPHTYYGMFQNDWTFPQMRRFETSQRLRFTINLESQLEPMLISDLPDLYPVTKQLTQTTDDIRTTYFQYCDRFYVRRARVNRQINLYGKSYMNYDYTLPHWIKFYELNGTFWLQPQQTSDKLSVEVQCCNNINQCATGEFNVIPKTARPVNLLKGLNKDYVIQFDQDPLSSVGQGFQWAMRQSYFYDTDRDPNNQPYNLSDHRAWIRFLSGGSTNLRYRQLYNQGMLFWQGYDLNIGSNNIKYLITDLDVSNSESQSLKLIVNLMPYRTAIGRAAKLPDVIDPCKEHQTSYFDSYLPHVKKEDIPEPFEVSVVAWFAQIDTDRLLYQITMSDRMPAPEWMIFHRELGKLEGTPSGENASQMLNLRFNVKDTMYGETSLYKTLLINCAPKPAVKIKYITFGLSRKAYLNLTKLIYDQDGDMLNFTLVNPDHHAILEKYGLYFQWVSRAIVGRPEMKGNLPIMKARATDPHGFFTETLLSIKIDDYRPRRVSRTADEIYQGIAFEVRGDTLFDFTLPENLYYDPQDSKPLVYFASDLANEELPKWIQFDPKTRHFHGEAPSGPRSLKIRVHAMNMQTHESQSFVFSLSVLKNDPLESFKSGLVQDVNVQFQRGGGSIWFEYTFPLEIFNLNATDLINQLALYQVNSQTLPSFARLNTDNRTLFGYLEPTHLHDGISRFDLILTDPLGRKSYANVKLHFLRYLPVDPWFYYPMYLATLTALLSFAIYFLYLFVTVHTLRMMFRGVPLWQWPFWVRALSRFGFFADYMVIHTPENDTGDKDRYQRTQTGKRVRGLKDGIKFDAEKNMPVWIPRWQAWQQKNSEIPQESRPRTQEEEDEWRIQRYIRQNLERTVAIKSFINTAQHSS